MGRLRALGAVATTLVVLTLAGCGDDDAPVTDPSPSSTPSGGESSPTGPATSEDTAEPADGELLQSGDTAYARVPDGWKVEDFEFGFGIQQAGKGLSTITWADFGAVAATTPRDLVKVEMQGNVAPDAEVSYDVELGGEPAYLLTERSGGRTELTYGAVRGGNAASVGFSLDPELPEAEQQEIIDSVLASFTWS
jgi:hypothetical protein